MFSFMSSIYKEEEAAPQQNANQSSMFGGMEVQAPEPAAPAASAFSFMATEEAPSSAFSFMQGDEPSEEPVASGFTFLSVPADAQEHSELVGDSLLAAFPFISGQPETTSSTNIETYTPTPSAPSAPSAMSFLAEPYVATDTHKGDIKLAKTSLSKQVKKKKRASKVGFGREEEDDEDEPAGPAGSVKSAAAAAPSSFSPAAAPASAMSSALSGISEIYIEESEGGYPDAALSLAAPLDVLSAAAPVSADVTPFSVIERLPIEITLPTVAPPPVPPSPQGLQERSLSFTATASTTMPAAYVHAEPSLSPTPHTAPSPSTPPPAAAAAAPLVPETTVQKLERKSRETLAQLVRGLADLSRLHSTALAGQDRFRQEIDAENARLHRARSRRDAAEQEQAHLAQMEDFEGADALSAVVDQCGAEMRASEAALRDLTGSVRMLELTFAEERADSINALCRTAATLKAAKEQLEGSAKQMQNSVDKQSAVEHARIAAELERIGLEKGHFEREESALSGDSERTEEAIRLQTGDLGERKEELQRAVTGIEEEIRVLQEQLAAKLAQRSALTADLDVVESGIGEVRRKYDRQLQRIADRQAALRQSKQECLQEEGAVLADQAALAAQALRDKAAAQEVREWAAGLELDAVVLDAFLANLSATGSAQSGGQIASISSVEASSGDGAEALRKNLEAILFLTTKKHATVGELRARCDVLLLESRRLGEQAPQLEAEKKAHAAAKRFKEAAVVAKDLKDVQSAKEGVDSELTASEAAMAHTLDEIEQLAAQQAAVEIQLADAQRKRDVDRFEHLLLRVQEVRSLQALVKKHARKLSGKAQVSAILDNSSTDSSSIAASSSTPQAVQAFLAIELGAVLREAAVVKARYGLPQSLEEAVGSVDESEDEGDALGGGGEAVAAVSPFPVEGDAGVLGSAADASDEARSRAGSECEGNRPSSRAGAEDERLQEIDAVTADGPASAGETMEGASEALDAQQEVAPAAPELDRAAMISDAKAAVAEVAQLSQRMDEASDLEDYEQAAELFEVISAVNEKLQKALDLLGCSAEQLSMLDS